MTWGTRGVSASSSRIAATLAATAQRLAAGDWRPEVDGILSSLADAVGGDAASLFELRPRDERWSGVLTAAWPRDSASDLVTIEELPDRWVRLLAEARALAGDTDRTSWYVTRILERGGRPGSLIVPIVTGTEAWGFILLERPRQGPSWSDDDLALLGTIGSVIGAAIVRGRADRHLRDVELRYQTLVEQIPAITYIDQPDPDSPTGFRPVFISPQSEAILGYAPEEIEGDPVLWIQLLHDEDRERALAADAGHHSTGDPLANEYRLLARDGRVVWVHDEARMVTDESGNPAYSHGVLLDITERKLGELELRRALDALAKAEAHRRMLLAEVVNAQEEERARVARGIHDEGLQQLAFAAMALESLRRSESDVKDDLDRVFEAVHAAMLNLRNLLVDLSPPMLEVEGLAAAIEQAVEHALAGTAIRRTFTGRIDVEPPPERAVTAYRIVQEAMANVRRHADASTVSVAVGADEDGITVRVRDDGTGFEVDANAREGHFGLAIMRERAELAGGWFRIESAPDDGTTIEAWIPAGGRAPSADEAAPPPSPS
jgi:PAS domain S-box-containing protein